jgi:hypothetical protein
MSGALLIGLLLGAGVLPASDVIPEAGDFRFQSIRKAANEKEWPFKATSGKLVCTKVLGKKAVYFIPQDVEQVRAFHIDIDLFSMSLINLGLTGILAPYANPEQLVQRIAPFVTMGQRLCDQEPGTVVPDTEL